MIFLNNILKLYFIFKQIRKKYYNYINILIV